MGLGAGAGGPGKRDAATAQRKFEGLVGYVRVRLTLPSALCPAEIFFFFFFSSMPCVMWNPSSLTQGSDLHCCSQHVESQPLDHHESPSAEIFSQFSTAH